MAKAFIAGCSGPRLTVDERQFFSDERPWALILFARNCRQTDQIRDLVSEFRDLVGWPDAPVLIDQEGGRVRRLRPPLVPDYPPGAVYGKLHDIDADAGLRSAWLCGRLIGADLADLGITVDCLPIVDVPRGDTSNVIGDRAYGTDPAIIARIGRAMTDGLGAAGVLPVLKHIPGHGPATIDSHLALPVVDTELETLRKLDFVPFRALRDLPLAMTAHVVYTAIDRDACATCSPKVIETIIRGELDYQGCLMSDDVSMRALGGEMQARVRSLFAAGCDLALHCNGDFAEMQAVAAASPELCGAALARTDAALSARSPAEPMDREALQAEFATLLAGVV
ncbi:beta-N-acetylhexosaminidase [Stappia sp. ES.058]|uniref:beta-N-acetylhexosaminidase n=1 Tax=Stappia sp. ES.058 TaxID=1881061 RepID=UPI00087D9B17|nr:beta-N-acetylhexosaminidase [Stappia sp. ES.058]SDU12537.1 beta-N-acetylhexosaminidase [Stappia sp. ES.058]